VNDETWMKTGMPVSLWAWSWQFWGEAAAQWMRAWTGLWTASAPQWLPADPAAPGALPLVWWPRMEATITPLQSAEGTEAVRLSMRLRIPGEEAVAVEAVVARGGDIPRLVPAEPEALPDKRGDRGAGK
jgi:hypothetical protein